MKEECKLCSVGWGGQTTDFSIASLMRPAPAHERVEPRHDAVLLSAYLLKLGYYQPAGPLIKETGADAERALARYHPPHYHAAHPPMIQQYGPPYYPADLCYGRYYRPPGPYHMPPPDAPMVNVGSEPYPSQFYGTPPCYQHSPRIPYVEYRACPCPLNACPKNVHIGPVTGKAPTGAGPDVAALAPPGGSLRAKISDTHGSGKDPPEPEPPAASDAPHPCPLPNIGGASPKRELPTRPAPPSPARGSAGATPPCPAPCALPCAAPCQALCPAPRRARLGKAMARRARDATTALSPARLAPSPDVLALSPPRLAPIDLSSSDDRSPPLLDVKKENEGRPEGQQTPARKPDAQALKEHNSPALDNQNDVSKPAKRRYSRPKLEIDMKDVTLEDGCKTNGIGEHVKLQKRRKVFGDQAEPPKIETVTKEPKRKAASATRRTLNAASPDKKCVKRKSEICSGEPKPKKLLLSSPLKQGSHLAGERDERGVRDERVVREERAAAAPVRSAPALLDSLLRNSGGRGDGDNNPAELFLTSKEKRVPSVDGRIHGINNNILQNANSVKDGLTNITSLECQTLKKKDQKSASNLGVVDSNITVNSKSVPRPSDKTETTEEFTISVPCDLVELNDRLTGADNADSHSETRKNKCDILRSDPKDCKNSISDKCDKLNKSTKAKKLLKPPNKIESKTSTGEPLENRQTKLDIVLEKGKPEIEDKSPAQNVTNEVKGRTVEKLVKLLASKNAAKLEESKAASDVLKEKKRSKLGIEKSTGKEKVAKLLVSKKSAIKTDTASLVIEDACSSWRRGRGRRGPPGRRRLGAALPLPAPAATPRWSNGWTWAGETYPARVYVNNDGRLDRVARCWTRMRHAGGDRVSRGDCVLLRAAAARAAPYVARVAALWESPDDGEMMVSLVWYYRPEHTALGRLATDAPDEVFASKHRDANSVACIEDKCYVLTFNEYCRYRKRLKAAEEGIQIPPSIVPPMPASEVTPAIETNDTKLPPSVSPELVLFCRKIYDFRSKKIQVPNK